MNQLNVASLAHPHNNVFSFGAKTEAAVEAYPKNKLTVDGIVGPKTWDELLSK